MEKQYELIALFPTKMNDIMAEKNAGRFGQDK